MNNKQQLGNQVEVRVRQTSAGPQIFVDGEVAAPHWFWGRDAQEALPIGNEWRRYTIPVVPGVTVEDSQVRFFFQPTAGTLEVRDFSFGSASGLSWKIEREATDPEIFKAVKTGRLERGRSHSMTFEARGEGIGWVRPVVEQCEDGPYKYIWVSIPPAEARHNVLFAQARMAIEAGARFITFYVPNCWMPEGQENWEPLDCIFRGLIEIDPGVLVVPRVTVNAPAWWQREHPDSIMGMEPGGTSAYGGLSSYACVSSREYRRDACAYLEKVCRHLMASFPRNFAGIHISGQNTNEWFYVNGWTTLSGYDRHTLAAFREWLARRGEQDAATAEVPPPEHRHPGLVGTDAKSLFLDPVADRRLVGFNTFLQEEMCDFIAAACRTCRAATGGRKLVLSFYGYLWEHTMLPLGPASGGHYALMRLLREAGDSIDALSAPITYRSERGWLGSTPQMSAVETLHRHGILLLAEDDTVTHLEQTNWEAGHATRETSARTKQQTQDILSRNLAVQAVRGFGSWWMDLHGFGTYKDRAMWNLVRRVAPLDRYMSARQSPFMPDVAMAVDEESMMYLRPVDYETDFEEWRDPTHGSFNKPMARPFAVWGALFAGSWVPLARIGASYGQFIIDDILSSPIKSPLQILPVFFADDAKAAALAALREAQPDATRIWCWAPAALSPRGIDLDQMRRVTGFTFRLLDGFSRAVHSTAAGLAVGLAETWGNAYQAKRGIAPRFAVEPEPCDEVWATWQDGSPAVVARQHGNGWEIFSGAIELPREFLAAVAKRAGIRPSLERPERATLWRNGGAICIQALEDGEQTLLFQEPSDVRDALTGDELASGVTRLPVSLRKGEVRVFVSTAIDCNRNHQQ